MRTILRGADRFVTEQSGIVTRHCFSSGAHYDPDNLSFGPLIACDEHRLAPGAGFERHPHARVELISWVLDGALHHEGPHGTRVVEPGQVQYQAAGPGIEHAERNASDSRPLRFVQFWLIADAAGVAYDVVESPVALASGEFRVLRHCEDELVPAGDAHLFVTRGGYTLDGVQLTAGDSVRIRDASARLAGDGEMLVLQLRA